MKGMMMATAAAVATVHGGIRESDVQCITVGE